MAIRTIVRLDEAVLERVRTRAREDSVPSRTKLPDLLRAKLAVAINAEPIQVAPKTYDMGTCALRFPGRGSDLDASDDGEKFGKRF